FFAPGPLPGPKGRVNFGEEFPDDREAILSRHAASAPESPGGFPAPSGAVDPSGKRRDDGQKILNELRVRLFRFFR
ncbi:hypothetical protein AB1399_11340, partial [Hydrogenibacillus schlegelii]|uniref:hypothetical protein n=1 Tax=Hydrogenibacillus schlegelii TaxID=1484 RepID=UPI0034A0A7A7